MSKKTKTSKKKAQEKERGALLIEPQPMPYTRTNTEIPTDYETLEMEYEKLDWKTDYPDAHMVITTQPSIPVNATLENHPDGWTECHLSGYIKRQILNYPGFPRPLQRTPKVRYEIRQAPLGGLGMFALDDLEMGDLVVNERPLIVAPIAENIPIKINKHYTEEMYILAHMAAREKRLQILIDHMDPTLRERFLALANSHKEDGSGPILGIIRTNAFSAGMRDRDRPGPTGEYGAVGDHVSRINHSCSPNVIYSFDRASFGMEIRAARPIRAGEEFFIQYIDILDTYEERREALARYGFQCTCRACLDPVASDARRAALTSTGKDDLPLDGSLSIKECMKNLQAFEQEGLENTYWYLQWLKCTAVAYMKAGDKDKTKEWRRKVYASALAQGGKEDAIRLSQF